MSGSTITGTVTMGITLGSAGYYSPLTVEQTGRVNPSQSTVAGVLVDNGLPPTTAPLLVAARIIKIRELETGLMFRAEGS